MRKILITGIGIMILLSTLATQSYGYTSFSADTPRWQVCKTPNTWVNTIVITGVQAGWQYVVISWTAPYESSADVLYYLCTSDSMQIISFIVTLWAGTKEVASGTAISNRATGQDLVYMNVCSCSNSQHATLQSGEHIVVQDSLSYSNFLGVIEGHSGGYGFTIP